MKISIHLIHVELFKNGMIIEHFINKLFLFNLLFRISKNKHFLMHYLNYNSYI